MNKSMLILGGDFRQLTVASEFKKEGFKVSVYGFNENYLTFPYKTYNNIEEAIGENEIIILGMPVSRDNIFLNTPYFKDDIRLTDITNLIDGSKTVFGGVISENFKNSLKDKKVKVFDYYLREELSVENVIPTVEGAISIAINETPFTIHGSKCLVCGFGRIGKILSKSLRALGADVTASARKLEDIAWIDCYGYKSEETKNIYEHINEFDIIFNTIPYCVIDEECLKRVKKDAVIIDLASNPGGVNFKYAKLLNVKAIHALALPGKIAPLTAGLIIKNTIRNILTEWGLKNG